MTEQMIQKRNHLKELSKIVSPMIEQGEISTINEGLAKIYADEGHTTLKSFKQWLADGFAPKKGSKALLLWGAPVKNEQQEQPPAEGEKEKSFFPVAFVFSQMQVIKINPKP